MKTFQEWHKEKHGMSFELWVASYPVHTAMQWLATNLMEYATYCGQAAIEAAKQEAA